MKRIAALLLYIFLFQNNLYASNKEECIEKSKKARETILERNCYFKQMDKVNEIYELI